MSDSYQMIRNAHSCDMKPTLRIGRARQTFSVDPSGASGGHHRRQPMDAPAGLFGYALGNGVPTLEAMPLLEELVEENRAIAPFKGVTALLIQHQLGNQGPQLDALVRLGLEPKKILWLDIPYTSNERFRRVAHERHGIPTRNLLA